MASAAFRPSFANVVRLENPRTALGPLHSAAPRAYLLGLVIFQRLFN